jgi:hypothetical protein
MTISSPAANAWHFKLRMAASFVRKRFSLARLPDQSPRRASACVWFTVGQVQQWPCPLTAVPDRSLPREGQGIAPEHHWRGATAAVPAATRRHRSHPNLHIRGVARTLMESSRPVGHGDFPHSEKTRSMG